MKHTRYAHITSSLMKCSRCRGKQLTIILASASTSKSATILTSTKLAVTYDAVMIFHNMCVIELAKDVDFSHQLLLHSKWTRGQSKGIQQAQNQQDMRWLPVTPTFKLCLYSGKKEHAQIVKLNPSGHTLCFYTCLGQKERKRESYIMINYYDIVVMIYYIQESGKCRLSARFPVAQPTRPTPYNAVVQEQKAWTSLRPTPDRLIFIEIGTTRLCSALSCICCIYVLCLRD